MFWDKIVIILIYTVENLFDFRNECVRDKFCNDSIANIKFEFVRIESALCNTFDLFSW